MKLIIWSPFHAGIRNISFCHRVTGDLMLLIFKIRNHSLYIAFITGPLYGEVTKSLVAFPPTGPVIQRLFCLCCQPQSAFQRKVDLPHIWDYITQCHPSPAHQNGPITFGNNDLTSMWPLETNFCEVLIEVKHIFKKFNFHATLDKGWLFCLGLNV